MNTNQVSNTPFITIDPISHRAIRAILKSNMKNDKLDTVYIGNVIDDIVNTHIGIGVNDTSETITIETAILTDDSMVYDIASSISADLLVLKGEQELVIEAHELDICISYTFAVNDIVKIIHTVLSHVSKALSKIREYKTPRCAHTGVVDIDGTRCVITGFTGLVARQMWGIPENSRIIRFEKLRGISENAVAQLNALVSASPFDFISLKDGKVLKSELPDYRNIVDINKLCYSGLYSRIVNDVIRCAI